MIHGVLLLSLALGSANTPATPTDIATTIVQTDKELNTLIVAHQKERARDFFMDDYLLTTSGGKTKTKADFLSEIGSPDLLNLEIFETSNPSVRVHGDVAVLTGLLHQRGTYKGEAIDAMLTVTDIWIHDGDRWRLLGGHAGKAPGEAKKP
jgi:ketosteroid isomerase-like protein